MRHSILIFLLIFSLKTSAQEYFKLSITDFQGTPDAKVSFLAYTQWRLNYRFNITVLNKTYTPEFKVVLMLDKDASWIKTNEIKKERLAYVLNHEQGHFKIGAIAKKELLQQFQAFTYSKNYKAEADSIFQKVVTKYKTIEQQYDKEIHAAKDTVQQYKWDAYLEESFHKKFVTDVR
ncbi:DUF922 domain-containing protein [Olivibacter domesticus]|uniref:DUF922 domain-containing protein n=1 Tax=Olivibacter domesticus TaxID=407022 RepID=A0A1H7GK45_OLID1|nr:hypothetical protein [Olivibacter domesticus]SEK38536.1 hypothetical protein SAMN05661044_00113 [Olivibacter domesticus]